MNFDFFFLSATGGELQTIIDNKGQLSEEKARTCMREVLRALNHLHKQSIIHLDLKPQNILLIGNDVEGELELTFLYIAEIVIFMISFSLQTV